MESGRFEAGRGASPRARCLGRARSGADGGHRRLVHPVGRPARLGRRVDDGVDHPLLADEVDEHLLDEDVAAALDEGLAGAGVVEADRQRPAVEPDHLGVLAELDPGDPTLGLHRLHDLGPQPADVGEGQTARPAAARCRRCRRLRRRRRARARAAVCPDPSERGRDRRSRRRRAPRCAGGSGGARRGAGWSAGAGCPSAASGWSGLAPPVAGPRPRAAGHSRRAASAGPARRRDRAPRGPGAPGLGGAVGRRGAAPPAAVRGQRGRGRAAGAGRRGAVDGRRRRRLRGRGRRRRR